MFCRCFQIRLANISIRIDNVPELDRAILIKDPMLVLDYP